MTKEELLGAVADVVVGVVNVVVDKVLLENVVLDVDETLRHWPVRVIQYLVQTLLK